MGNNQTFNLNVLYPPKPISGSPWQRLHWHLIQLIQVHPGSPAVLQYFKSEVSVLDEKVRHYENFRYTIHPLSRFNYYHQVFCCCFYFVMILYKVLEFGFMQIAQDDHRMDYYTPLMTAMPFDLIYLINMVPNFFIGYCSPYNKHVELSKKQIAKRYLLSGHFLCDLLSSIPRIWTWNAGKAVKLTVATLSLLKIRRTFTVIECTKALFHLLGIKSKTYLAYLGWFVIVFVCWFTMIALHAGVPQYRACYQGWSSNSYVNEDFMRQKTLTAQVFMTFFKICRYTFLISFPQFPEATAKEEMLCIVFNYFVSKVLLVITYVVILNTFLGEGDVMRHRFEEVMTELEEFMRARSLPEELQERMVLFYKFKYQKLFFNETLISSVLSGNLKKEVEVFLCKSLIQQVELFSHVPPKTIKQLVSYLEPQIFFPNDLIIQSGTYGDAMFLIQSGTVAVYTASGKEVCHLQEGAYFGESCLIFASTRRPLTVISVEFTQIYSLKKRLFQECFPTNDRIYRKLMHNLARMVDLLKAKDEKHRSKMFRAQMAR